MDINRDFAGACCDGLRCRLTLCVAVCSTSSGTLSEAIDAARRHLVIVPLFSLIVLSTPPPRSRAARARVSAAHTAHLPPIVRGFVARGRSARARPKFPSFCRSGPSLANSVPSFANLGSFGPTSAEFGQLWPKLDQIWLEFGHLWPDVFPKSRSDFSRVRPKSAKRHPTQACATFGRALSQVGRMEANSGRMSRTFG